MEDRNDSIEWYNGGLNFSVDGDFRPRLQDWGDSLQVYTENGSFNINKEDADDLIKLLTFAKTTKYTLSK
ncbi:hypothetical protein [Bacillus infantis]|uniref:hypothetical protein n=1 Tax=Bacillus infantis TaxID=324767 RepID=UPI003CF1BBCB